MSTKSSPEPERRLRVFAYIDGFNVYYGLKHASKEADRLHLTYGRDPRECTGRSLYWLDLEAVVLSQIRAGESCSAIKYFSAPRRVPKRTRVVDKSRYVESNERQRLYLEALATRPLMQLVLGWYAEGPPHKCSTCHTQWPNFEEKVTDVNIATHMLVDAYEDRFDVALVLSADADLVPPVEAVRKLGKAVVIALFPGRRLAANLSQHANEVRNIKLSSLRSRQFPKVVTDSAGREIHRPDVWGEPGGWIWHDPAPVVFAKPPTKRSSAKRHPRGL